MREAAELIQSPSPDFHAAPASDSDLFDWHFTVRGPPSSVFASGIYHGRIILPPTYPLRPPSFRFLNSSGRFEVNREICLSISGHHEETWMPAWGVRTALIALRSFMETDPKGQIGGLECTNAERENFARESVGWVCNICKKKNEDILKECQESLEKTCLEKKPVERPEMHPGINISSWDKSEEKNAQQINDSTLHQTELHNNHSQFAQDFIITGESSVPKFSSPSLSSESQLKISSCSAAPISADYHTKDYQHQQPTSVGIINRESPLWIDRAIVTVIICLVAMILKVLLGL